MSACGRFPFLSVVVPVFNQANELAQQLAAIVAQECSRRFEVVVADNGSTDRTAAVIATWTALDHRVRRVDASARRGPAAARNVGAALASGDALIFCDADDVVAPGWLEALATALEDADLVAGAFDFDSLNGVPVRGPFTGYTSQFGFLPAGLGANLAVSRVAFDTVGGFAENMSAGEDINLCWRIQLAGFRFVEAGDAVVAKRERRDRRARGTQWFNYGRHDAGLYADFRVHGMPRNGWQTVKTYAWLFLNAPRAILDVRCRMRWVQAFYLRWGRLVGSVEHRVLYL